MSPPLAARCSKAPTGYYCTRCEGHPGPCAAHPDPSEEITRPDLSDLLVIQMAAMFGNLKAHERARAIELLSNWSKCSADRRACVEFSARELAKVPSEVI